MTSAQAATRQSLVESISRDLTEQILAGKLAPGRHISQLSIAEHYGVSRQPVRQALHALSSQGLVVIEPARGARVAALDSNDLREVYLMRERLEPMAVGLAVPHVTEAATKEAEELILAMEGLAAGDSEWLRLDRQFHSMWYDLTGMPRLVRAIDQLCDVAQRYRALFNLTPGANSISDLEHWLLLEALRRRSAADAEALLEVHLRRVRLTLDSSAPPVPPSRLRTAD